MSQLTSQNKKYKHRMSVLVAFHKLLNAARGGADVLLLDQRDVFANLAMQQYNDAHGDDRRRLETDYGQFSDYLAEEFNRYANNGGVGEPKLPSDAAIAKADELLTSLLG